MTFNTKQGSLGLPAPEVFYCLRCYWLHQEQAQVLGRDYRPPVYRMDKSTPFNLLSRADYADLAKQVRDDATREWDNFKIEILGGNDVKNVVFFRYNLKRCVTSWQLHWVAAKVDATINFRRWEGDLPERNSYQFTGYPNGN